MVHIFTMVMSCYDWAADKSLCDPVRFYTKFWGAVCLAGLKCACASGGVGEEELVRGMGEGVVEEELVREIWEIDYGRGIDEGRRRMRKHEC